MDEKVTRVLEIFHERIASEGQARGSGARPTRRDRDRDKLHLKEFAEKKKISGKNLTSITGR